MKVSQLVPVEHICIGWPEKLKSRHRTKWKLIQDGLRFLCEQAGYPNEVFESAIQSVNEREKAMTTAIGNGIAVPHGTLPSLSAPAGACIILQEGIDFDAIDHEPVYVIFLVMLPDKQYQKHIQTLSNIVFLTNHADLKDRLVSLNTSSEVWESIAHLEE